MYDYEKYIGDKDKFIERQKELNKKVLQYYAMPRQIIRLSEHRQKMVYLPQTKAQFLKCYSIELIRIPFEIHFKVFGSKYFKLGYPILKRYKWVVKNSRSHDHYEGKTYFKRIAKREIALYTRSITQNNEYLWYDKQWGY